MESVILARRAVAADLSQIQRLLEQVDDSHREALPWLLRKVDEPRSQDFLDGFFDERDKAAFVVGDEHLLGLILVLIREPKPLPILHPARVAEIDTIVVDALQRRHGIGRQLVHAAVAWGREQGASRTELGVYEFNDSARAFWSAMGFGTLSRRLVLRD